MILFCGFHGIQVTAYRPRCRQKGAVFEKDDHTMDLISEAAFSRMVKLGKFEIMLHLWFLETVLYYSSECEAKHKSVIKRSLHGSK
jgi:hypothetical protein